MYNDKYEAEYEKQHIRFSPCIILINNKKLTKEVSERSFYLFDICFTIENIKYIAPIDRTVSIYLCSYIRVDLPYSTLKK